MSRPHRPKFQSLYLWHRYTGISCSILVLILAISGLLIQHADSLHLQQRYLPYQWLLNWYGMQPASVASFKIGDHWLSQSGDFIYLDGTPIDGRYGPLKGASETVFGYAAVSGSDVLLLSTKGEIIETLSVNNGLPESALGIAFNDSGVIIRGSSKYWLANDEFLNWQPYQGPHPLWVKPAIAPGPISQAAQLHSYQHQISWERFLLDLHSGRLFGDLGKYIMDIAAIGLILLASSGLWVWTQRRRKDRHHTKH